MNASPLSYYYHQPHHHHAASSSPVSPLPHQLAGQHQLPQLPICTVRYRLPDGRVLSEHQGSRALAEQ